MSLALDHEPRKQMPVRYTVYIIELSRKVYTAHWMFGAADPQYNGALECLCVGMPSQTRHERLR